MRAGGLALSVFPNPVRWREGKFYGLGNFVDRFGITLTFFVGVRSLAIGAAY